jgi:hypothetical protein
MNRVHEGRHWHVAGGLTAVVFVALAVAAVGCGGGDDAPADASRDAGSGPVPCVANRDCRAGQVCLRDFCACETDIACDGAEICVGSRCVPRICMPGSARCASAGVREVCDTRGAEYVAMPCASSEVCSEGVCELLMSDAGAGDGGVVDAGDSSTGGSDVCGDVATPVLSGTTRALAVDTTGASASSLTPACSGTTARGNDRFFAIDVSAGEFWHFHLVADPSFAPMELDRDPVVYVVSGDGAGGCNDRPMNCAAVFANLCSGRSDEHVSFVAPSTGRFYVGIDDANPGGGHYLLDAFRPACGNGLQEHGESCDDTTSGTCSPDCRKLVGRTMTGDSPLEAEFNDNPVEANRVEFFGATTTQVEIAGDVGGGGDCYPDVFEVRVETMGTDVRIEALTATGAACTSPSSALYTLQLRDASGTSRGTPVVGAPCPSVEALSLPVGVYTIWVRASDPAATAPAAYRLRVRRE